MGYRRRRRRCTNDAGGGNDDVRDRGWRAGRREGGRDAARPRGSTATSCSSATSRSARTSARRWPRATCSARTNATRSSSTRPTGTTATTSTCALAPPSPRSTARALVAFDGGTHRLRQAAAHDRRLGRADRRSPALTSATCSTCGRWRSRSALRAAFTPAARVVIVGAGWIGLEAAAAARQAGCSVTIVEPQPGAAATARSAPSSARSSPTCTARTAWCSASASRSTEFRPAEVSGSSRAGRSREGWPVGWVVTDSGAELPADVVVGRHRRGPQRRPRHGRPGLEVDNGVRDRRRRCAPPTRTSSRPGDVANSYLPLLGRHVRVDHWANALHGGQAAAQVHARPGRRVQPRAVLLQRPVRPGHGVLGPAVARQLRPGRSTAATATALEFIAFWLNEGRLVAGMNVNVWDVTDDIQALIRSGRRPRPRPPGRPRHPPSRRLNPTTPSKLNGPGPRTARGNEQPPN